MSTYKMITINTTACRSGLIGHHGNKQVGNTGCAHFAQRSELPAISTIEEQDAAAKPLALVHGLESPGRGQLVRIHHHLQIARLHFFHAAMEHDAAAVDEHEISEDVLDLLHLMCGHNDGTAAVEVIAQQGIVELLAVQDVEAEGRFVEHQQSGVDGHDQSQMKLSHHALRQFSDLLGGADAGPGKERFCLGAIESWMHAGNVVEGLPDLYPARQHGDIGNEADIAHELIALVPGVATEHPQFALIWGEAENRVERGGLAGAVGTDEPQDAALFHAQVDAVQRDGCAEGLAEPAGFYACHGFNAPPASCPALYHASYPAFHPTLAGRF